VRVAIVAVTIDAVLSVVFVHLLPPASGQGGLALATAVANSIQAVWLVRLLDRRLGGIGLRSLQGTLIDTAIASAAMALVVYDLLAPLSAIFAQRGFGALVTVAIEVALGGATFLAVTYLLGAPELAQVEELVRRR
jgi:putative peptidoglycan lipid II flippase